MRSFLIVIMLALMLPASASRMDIQPGRFGFSTDSFAFHSRERTMYLRFDPVSYGRLDLSPYHHTLSDPHGSGLSLAMDARDSVKRGVRGMLFSSRFLDFSVGMGSTPEFSMAMKYGNLDMSFDFKHGKARRKPFISSWDRSLEKDMFTLGFRSGSEYGLSILSLFSLSPSTSTRVFTGIALDTECLEVELGRGNTLISSKDTESSLYLKGMGGGGYVFISDRTGKASYRPSSFTETERELGYGFRIGSAEFGCSTKVDFTRNGKWKRKVTRYVDLGYAKFTFVDGRMHFSMDRVQGFSIGLSGRNSSISFRYKGMEIRRYYDGSWSFSLSIEPTKE